MQVDISQRDGYLEPPVIIHIIHFCADQRECEERIVFSNFPLIHTESARKNVLSYCYHCFQFKNNHIDHYAFSKKVYHQYASKRVNTETSGARNADHVAAPVIPDLLLPQNVSEHGGSK
jgi:hypothetical protein